jgi:capsid protein
MKKPAAKPKNVKAQARPAKGPGATYDQYASTTTSGQRRMLFLGKPKDARQDLNASTRSQMVAISRWAVRNSPIYNQMVNELVMVVVGNGLVAQSACANPESAAAYESYFRDFSKRCDITGRLSLGKVFQMWMGAGLFVDGDIFTAKVYKDGKPRLQVLESHRVGNPAFDTNSAVSDGVYLGSMGEVIGYNVISDNEARDNFVEASSMIHIVDLDRASSVRGFPVAQSSLNSVRDQLEVFSLEVRACRDSADYTRVLKKQGGVLTDDPAEAISGRGKTCQDIANEMGGKTLVLDVNESFEQFINSRPSPAWVGMMKAIERDIVKVLPYEYVSDASSIGGVAVRLIASKVSRIADHYQQIIKEGGQEIWDWVIADGIAKGELPEEPDFNRTTWTTPRDVTVDAGREAAQDRADLQMGLTTASAILAKKGMDYDDVVATRVREMRGLVEAAKAADLPLWMLYQSSFNWLQQGQGSDQVPDTVAENLNLPEQPTP